MKSGIILKISLLAIVSFFMAGCQSLNHNDMALNDMSVDHAGHSSDVYYVDEGPAEEAVTLREERVFSYEYDSSRLSPEEVNDIAQYADRFLENPSARIRMEGHTESTINY